VLNCGHLQQAYGYKTANWPTVTKDKIIIWSRPHPKSANPTAPTLARPRNWQYTDDTLYAFVLAVTDCQVTLTSGANTMTVNVKAGSSRLSITSAPGQISTSMSRNGKVVVQYASGSAFQYTNTPKDYNYNYFVASTP
jgi:glucan endo-1,3-alpha-glucosidase